MKTHYETGSDYSEKLCRAMDGNDTTRNLDYVSCPECLKLLRNAGSKAKK